MYNCIEYILDGDYCLIHKPKSFYQLAKGLSKDYTGLKALLRAQKNLITFDKLVNYFESHQISLQFGKIENGKEVVLVFDKVDTIVVHSVIVKNNIRYITKKRQYYTMLPSIQPHSTKESIFWFG